MSSITLDSDRSKTYRILVPHNRKQQTRHWSYAAARNGAARERLLWHEMGYYQHALMLGNRRIRKALRTFSAAPRMYFGATQIIH
jgi:hypothetical protein